MVIPRVKLRNVTTNRGRLRSLKEPNSTLSTCASSLQPHLRQPACHSFATHATCPAQRVPELLAIPTTTKAFSDKIRRMKIFCDEASQTLCPLESPGLRWVFGRPLARLNRARPTLRHFNPLPLESGLPASPFPQPLTPSVHRFPPVGLPDRFSSRPGLLSSACLPARPNLTDTSFPPSPIARRRKCLFPSVGLCFLALCLACRLTGRFCLSHVHCLRQRFLVTTSLQRFHVMHSR